jgi:ligand-binding SRPBCC domain-containing protein
MLTFEKRLTINRPRQEVFDFVSDPANDALYRSDAEFAEWSSEAPIGVGSSMRSVSRFMGREVETTSEFTVWDPPETYAFRTVGGSFPARYTMVFDSVEGGTRLTARGEIAFKGVFKVVEWLFGKQIKAQAESDFDALKLLLEAS